MKLPFEIIQTIRLSDGSYDLFINIEPEHQIYLVYVLEAMEGYCFHTIVDARLLGKEFSKSTYTKKTLKVTVVPDYFEELKGLLSKIKDDI